MVVQQCTNFIKAFYMILVFRALLWIIQVYGNTLLPFSFPEIHQPNPIIINVQMPSLVFLISGMISKPTYLENSIYDSFAFTQASLDNSM